jgi:hypothetical protein
VVRGASSPVFMFCALGHIFGGSEGVGCTFHVLRSQIHFWRYRGRRVPFLCFSLLDSFSTVSRASVPVFLFYAPIFIFSGFVGVGSSFALLNSFSTLPWVSGPVFIFCAPGLIFYVTEGVGSSFHVLRFRTRFRQ